MMKYWNFITLLVIVLISFCSCDGDDPAQGPKLPENLVVEIDHDPATGKASVHASADHTNYYHIFFGEESNDNGIVSTSGNESYTYKKSGTFTIKVRAHVTANDFIEKEEQVTVNFPDPNVIVIPAEGFISPETYSGMTLVWQDEFDGPTINSSNWTFETGGHGWGNNELQYYRAENAQVKDGHLVITAKKENFGGRNYTSTRMITQGKKSFQYGRIDIRAALPYGQGIWPALWMLGSNFGTAGWPACGEIDIMEMIGGSGREKTVHGTLHWQNEGQHASFGRSHSLDAGTFHDKFHVFSIVWNQNNIKWYVDDVLYSTIDITPAELSEFRNDFFFIFNIAVGGNWPGDPNASTIFPQHLIVDYVRVFQ